MEVDPSTLHPLSEHDLILLSCPVNQVTVRRFEEHIFHVKAGQFILWRFSTLDFDIGFSVEMNNEIKVPVTRYKSHEKIICGTLEAQQNAICKLKWDNSYAKLRTKQLSWVAKVVNPEEYHTAKLQARELPPNATAKDAEIFCIYIINQTNAYAAAYKPNIAFFESFGYEGIQALIHTISSIPDDIPIILDNKRGDIDTTAQAYAYSAYDVLLADAVTLSPYMGWDSIKPFVTNQYDNKAAFILCKTSNQSSIDIQDQRLFNGEKVYEHVAKLCSNWNKTLTNSNIGIVVGATDTQALQTIRKLVPDIWILCPGVGAQGGDAKSVCLSGLRISPYFFNAGLFDCGLSMSLLGRYYAEAIRQSGIEFDVIFGPAYKGIPLATAVSIAWYHLYDENKDVAYNRKEVKDHGEGGSLVGASINNRRVLIVDDVITAGTAIRESVELLQSNQALLVAVVVSLDRQEKVTEDSNVSAIQQVSSLFNVPVISIITLKNLIAFVSSNSTNTELSNNLTSIQEYRDRYGVDY
eukprot:gene20523-26619_t